MLFLSEASLRYAVGRILETTDYSVYIICPDNEKCNDVMETVEELAPAYEIDRTWINNRGYYIFFANGGTIRIYAPNPESKYTVSYHLLIVDEKLDMDLVTQNMKDCERKEFFEKFSSKFIHDRKVKLQRDNERATRESGDSGGVG